MCECVFSPASAIQEIINLYHMTFDQRSMSGFHLSKGVFFVVFFLQNIQKMLGLAPSRAATKQAGGFLGPPPQAAKFS